jgi:hypothetical protein
MINMQLKLFAYRLTRTWLPVIKLVFANSLQQRLLCLAGCNVAHWQPRQIRSKPRRFASRSITIRFVLASR